MLYPSHNVGEKKLPFCCLHLTVLSNDQTEGEPEMNVLSRGMKPVQPDTRKSEGSCSLELPVSVLAQPFINCLKSPNLGTLGSLCRRSSMDLVSGSMIFFFF